MNKETTIEVPREEKQGKRNPQITILCEELCLAFFDKDTTGKSHHLSDITRAVCPAMRHSYPEIKTRAQCEIYVFWAVKTLCWNNRAKMIDQDWFEAPGGPNDAINDHLPEGSPWQNRIPAKFDSQTKEQNTAWHQAVEMATWAVKHLKGWFPTWDDQRIIDLLYNGKTHYAPRSVETAIKMIGAQI